MSSKFFISLFAFFSFSAWSFKSVYLSFYTPKTWTCVSFGINHLCHYKDENTKKILFVVVSAVMTLESDKIENYIQDSSKTLTINSHKWLDFLPDTNSRGILERRQIAICCQAFDYTFRVSVAFYTPLELYSQYLSLILRMINSFNLDKNNMQGIRNSFQNQKYSDIVNLQKYLQSLFSEENPFTKKNKFFLGNYWIWLTVVIFLLFVFFIRRRYKKRKLKEKIFLRKYVKKKE
ncbi:MAG: hypothetical protein GDA46_07205 [Bdellovibrionales bacterium]|nr:hypothetical protein [Bdellovibrionales bacterium]